MRIDESHRSWGIASLTIFIVAVIGYVPYELFYPGGPNGNTWPGLIYGALGYSMMLYAGLMGARKKVPLWRIGRAQTWMRGHIWLGALSLPMIMLHAAFTARGPLTLTLAILLGVVVLSGITGAVLQHIIPKRITGSVQLETIYEQIPVVREQLFHEASAIVDTLCAVPEGVAAAASSSVVAGTASAGLGSIATDEEPAGPDLTDEQRANLRHVYKTSMFPFLRDPEGTKSPLSDAVKAKAFFDALRRQSPAAIHEALTDLESIFEEERQLIVQRRKYLLLHGWLLVHVPLSITLLVLGGIHALVAIHY
ncbi:MAG: hypothetical protein ABUS49_12920 [Acidobacteriota bacterium]